MTPRAKAIAVLAVVLGVSAGGDAFGQGVPATILPATTQPATAQRDAAPDPAELRRRLDSARADAAAASKAPSPPPGATTDEGLEQLFLKNALVAALARQLDLIERLPVVLRRTAGHAADSTAWTPESPPASVSVLVVDRHRKLLAVTQARLDNLLMRAEQNGEDIREREQTLKAAEGAVRLAAERNGRAGEDRSRAAWLLELARLRARVTAAELEAAKAAKAVDDTEIRGSRALIELQRRQLGHLYAHVCFPQADLDDVLSTIDQRTAALQGQLAQLLNSRALSDQLSRSSDGVARRVEAETDELAIEVLRGKIEMAGWERAGWLFRWSLFHGRREHARAPLAKLEAMIERLEGWSRYLQQENLRVERQMKESGAIATGAGDADLRPLYGRQVAILTDARHSVDDVLSTFRVWREDYHDAYGERHLGDILGDGWRALRDGAQAVWEFEMFAATEETEVDGHRITTSRSITIGKALEVVILTALGVLLTRRSLRAFYQISARRFGVPTAGAQTLGRWVHVLVVSLLFFLALYIVNIPLTVFAFLGGALAIGVGFGAQVTLKNMISGIMLLVERPLRVGDIVEVGSVVGTVTQISIRSSTIRTVDGIEILVPNASFIENNVTNWTYSTTSVRRSVTVGTDYAVPPKRVAAVLMGVAVQHPLVLKDPAPCVLLDSFGSDALIFSLRYWINYAEAAVDGLRIASDLRFMIAEALTEAGIDIPLPQRVLQVKNQDVSFCAGKHCTERQELAPTQ